MLGGWAWAGLSLDRLEGGQDHATPVQLTAMRRGREGGRKNNRERMEGTRKIRRSGDNS